MIAHSISALWSHVAGRKFAGPNRADSLLYCRTANQNLALLDLLRPAEAMKADRLEVAMAVAVAEVATVAVDLEDLLPLAVAVAAVDARSS